MLSHSHGAPALSRCSCTPTVQRFFLCEFRLLGVFLEPPRIHLPTYLGFWAATCAVAPWAATCAVTPGPQLVPSPLIICLSSWAATCAVALGPQHVPSPLHSHGALALPRCSCTPTVLLHSHGATLFFFFYIYIYVSCVCWTFALALPR